MKNAYRLTLLLWILFCPASVYAGALHEPEVAVSSAVVLDAATGIVLYEHNKDQRNYPASTTKIMTALLAIENSDDDYDSRVYFSHDAVSSIEPGSSSIGMAEGESLTLNDALYGMLLQSANEVANALAESVSGTTNAFARRMTARAAELGAVHTQFMNAHGLPDEEHYTTAYDMALIMREAVKNPKFVEVISTRMYVLPPTEIKQEERTVNNTNRMIQPHTSYFNEWVVGGKTGFTDDARHTLVTYAQRGEIGLIVAVMRGEPGEQYMDTAALIEYGFEQFEDVEIFTPDMYEAEVPVIHMAADGADASAVPAGGGFGGAERAGTAVAKADRSVTRFLPKQAAQYITTEASLPKRVTAPVAIGDSLGELRVYCNGSLQAVLPLAATAVIDPPVILPSDEPVIDEPDSTQPTQPDNPVFDRRIAIGAVVVAVLSAVLTLVSLRVLSGSRVSRR